MSHCQLNRYQALQADALLNGASTLLAQGRDSDATRLLEELLKLDPRNVDGLRALARIRMLQQQPHEAISLLKNALEVIAAENAATFESQDEQFLRAQHAEQMYMRQRAASADNRSRHDPGEPDLQADESDGGQADLHTVDGVAPTTVPSASGGEGVSEALRETGGPEPVRPEQQVHMAATWPFAGMHAIDSASALAFLDEAVLAAGIPRSGGIEASVERSAGFAAVPSGNEPVRPLHAVNESIDESRPASGGKLESEWQDESPAPLGNAPFLAGSRDEPDASEVFADDAAGLDDLSFLDDDSDLAAAVSAVGLPAVSPRLHEERSVDDGDGWEEAAFEDGSRFGDEWGAETLDLPFAEDLPECHTTPELPDAVTRAERAFQIAEQMAEACGWGKQGTRLLAGLLEQNWRPASQAAIQRAIDGGMTQLELCLAEEVRQMWYQRCDFWLGVTRGGGIVQKYPLISWPTALHLIRSFQGYPQVEEVEMMLDDCLEQWTASADLQRRFPAFFSYALYRCGARGDLDGHDGWLTFSDCPSDDDVGDDPGLRRELERHGLHIDLKWQPRPRAQDKPEPVPLRIAGAAPGEGMSDPRC